MSNMSTDSSQPTKPYQPSQQNVQPKTTPTTGTTSQAAQKITHSTTGESSTIYIPKKQMRGPSDNEIRKAAANSNFASKTLRDVRKSLSNVKKGVNTFIQVTYRASKGEKTFIPHKSALEQTATAAGNVVGGAIKKGKENLSSLREEVKFSAGIGTRAAERNMKDNILAEAKVVLEELKGDLATAKEGEKQGINRQINKMEGKVKELEQFAKENPTISERIVNFARGSSDLKLPLAPFLLNSIWGLSSALRIPGFTGALNRSELNNPNVEPVDIRLGQFISKSFGEGYFALKDRYADYSVFPTYPTRPVELTEGHKRMLEGNETKEAKELLKSAESGSPVYMELTPEARKLFNEVNLDLVKEHLQDIAKLANETDDRFKPDLSHLGMDYFENEIYDTLSRGLAFIDKSMLTDIEVPVKQADGSFEMQNFDIERFNISGRDAAGEIDHSVGHPIFFLKPQVEGTPPLIVARGTLLADDGNDGAQESVEADGRKDMSLKWVMENKELKTKMKDMHAEYGPIKVCGHSLGGNIALVLSARFFNLIDSTVAISAPQVSNEIYEEWKKIPENQRPKVQNILVEGDLVPGGGDKIMGFAVLAEQNITAARRVEYDNPVERHLKPFNNGNVRYAAVDKEEETDKTLRKMATFNVAKMGRLVQDKSFMEIVRGTGRRETALDDLATEIQDNLEKLSEEQLDAIAELGGYVVEDFTEEEAQLERLSPAELAKIFEKNPTLPDKLKNEVSPELFLKIYIAETCARPPRIFEVPEKFLPLVALYQSQLDR